MSMKAIAPGQNGYDIKGSFWGASSLERWSREAAQEMKNTLDREIMDVICGTHDDYVASAAITASMMPKTVALTATGLTMLMDARP